MPEPLNEESLQQALSGFSFIKECIYFSEINSTNDYLKKNSADASAEGTMVFAEKQTHGRGRFGKSWDSPASMGLWFSILFMPQLNNSDEIQWMRLGVNACSSAIQEFCDIKLQIKWPNDLYFDNRKVCGVLTEIIRKRDCIRRVVMGIGLNVNQTEKDFHSSVRDGAISLRMILNREIDRLGLLIQIVRQLEIDYLFHVNKSV